MLADELTQVSKASILICIILIHCLSFYCFITTGYQSVSALLSRHQSLCTSGFLRGLAPAYLTSTSSDAGRRHLRSANTRQLIIPPTSLRGQVTESAVSLFVVPVSGTACQGISGQCILLITFRNRLKYLCLTLTRNTAHLQLM